MCALVAALAASATAIQPGKRARADDAATTAVDVTVAGSEDDLDTFLEALREPLEALHLRVRGGRGDAPADHANGGQPTVWINLRPADHVEIVVGAGTRTVHRSIPHDPSHASRAVVAEDVAYAVRATLESLLVEAPPMAPRPENPLPPPVVEPVVDAAAPPVQAPSSPTVPPPPDGFGLDVTALANVRGVAASTAVFGAAAAVDLAFWGRRRWRPSLWILGGFDAPFSTVPTSEVELTTKIYSLRAVADIELLHAGPLRFVVGAGYGVDFFRVDSNYTQTLPIMIAPPTTFADPAVTAQFVVRARLFQSAGLLLAATLDYDTAPHHYVEASGDVTSNVLAPWTVRPAVYLGVCFRLTGASGCGGAW